MLTNPVELMVHKYLGSLRGDDAVMSPQTIEQIVSDVKESLHKQFVDKRESKFRLRMSNLGRPYCQLWFDKNKPETASTPSSSFVINMMIGDVLEAVFKGLLTASGIKYDNGTKVTMKLNNGVLIDGTPDLIMNGRVDDVKSASPWSYENKFKDFDSLNENDSFGYVAQLAGYARAANVEVGGWWVINKGNGSFKYVDASNRINVDNQVHKFTALTEELKENRFRRVYSDEEETYRKKPSGNRKLKRECSWCSYKHTCWPNLQERPSLVSRAAVLPMENYTEIRSV